MSTKYYRGFKYTSGGFKKYKIGLVLFKKLELVRIQIMLYKNKGAICLLFSYIY